MKIVTLNKDHEIDSLKKESLISSLKYEKTKYYSIIFALSLAFMGSILLVLARHHHKMRINKNALEKTNAELGRLNAELHDKIHEIKTLGGLLPICSQCKKIRNDRGYWEQLEGYISTHSSATFTHGICPNCADDLYPEAAQRIREKQAGATS